MRVLNFVVASRFREYHSGRVGNRLDIYACASQGHRIIGGELCGYDVCRNNISDFHVNTSHISLKSNSHNFLVLCTPVPNDSRSFMSLDAIILSSSI